MDIPFPDLEKRHFRHILRYSKSTTMKHSNPLSRIMVALDLSEHDEPLISYVSAKLEMAPIDKIYFVHVVPSLQLPVEIVAKYPDLVAPVDESVRKSIEYSIEKFGNFKPDVSIEIVIKEGDTATQLLKTIQEKSIDLLVMGRKNGKEANLRIVKKVVRTAPCSISIIPEFIPGRFNRLLIPMDFSENSLMAMMRALDFKSQYPDLQLLTFHGYEVPPGYTRIGKTLDEFSEIMKANAEKEQTNFLKKHNIAEDQFTPHFIRCKSSHLPSSIYQFAVANNVDAIVIGSRGRDSISALILGSVTEGLIEHELFMPLIIIKSKTDYMGLLDSLQEI